VVDAGAVCQRRRQIDQARGGRSWLAFKSMAASRWAISWKANGIVSVSSGRAGGSEDDAEKNAWSSRAGTVQRRQQVYCRIGRSSASARPLPALKGLFDQPADVTATRDQDVQPDQAGVSMAHRFSAKSFEPSHAERICQQPSSSAQTRAGMQAAGQGHSGVSRRPHAETVGTGKYFAVAW